MTVAKNGTVLLERSTDDTTYTTIPGVRSFNPGDMQAEQLDATDYDSPGSQREYENGLKDASDGSFEINFDPGNTVHQSLIADAGGATIYLRHKYDTRNLTVPANVISVSTPAEVGGILRATVTFRPASAPTWADVA